MPVGFKYIRAFKCTFTGMRQEYFGSGQQMFSQQKPFRKIYKLSKIDLLQQIKRKLAIKMIICSVLEVYETTLIPMCVARKLDQFQ